VTSSEILENRDVLVLSPSEWKDNAVSNMHISAILSENNRVGYVETMGGRMPRWSEVGRVWARLKRMIGSASTARGNRQGLDPRNVQILTPFAIPIHGNWLVDRVNQKLLVVQIRRFLSRLGMRRPLIWSFSPRWESVVANLAHDLSIFHCVDALSTYDTSPSFRSQFERTVKQADLVFTPGILLEQELRQLNPSTFRIGHGCGQEHLDYKGDGSRPEDIGAVSSPYVIYAGTLANWIDYELLTQAAEALPKVSFVLIGYVHAFAPKALVERLVGLDNVHSIGYKNYSELPRYYEHASVGIIPYMANNEHIQYSTPTKILDYLAAGLPVVSTRFPASESMQPMITCVSSAEEFISAVVWLLETQSEQSLVARRQFAIDNSWEAQVGKMCHHITEFEIAAGRTKR